MPARSDETASARQAAEQRAHDVHLRSLVLPPSERLAAHVQVSRVATALAAAGGHDFYHLWLRRRDR